MRKIVSFLFGLISVFLVYTVAQTTTVSPNSATVSWIAPTTNTDGTPVGNQLANYVVYYGTSISSLNSYVTINVPATTTTITSLPSGTWYFGVEAVNTSGIPSAMSNIASKTIAVASNETPNAPTGLTVQ